MGNPASKEISPSQARNYSHLDLQPNGERNDRDTPKKTNDDLEIVPYTSYSIPRKQDNIIVPTEEEEEEILVNKKISKTSKSPPKKDSSSRRIDSKKDPGHEALQDRDLMELEKLPIFDPIVKPSDRGAGRKLLYGETLSSKFHNLDSKGILSICGRYKELLEQSSSAVAKHQKDLPSKMKAADALTQHAFKIFNGHVQQVNAMTQYIRQINDTSENVITMNKLLRSVITTIEEVNNLLPEDMRINEKIPVPVLTLTQTLNLAPDKNMIYTHQKIPHSTRGTAWQRAVGNQLGITREQYVQFIEQVAIKVANRDPSDSEMLSVIRLIKLDIPRTFPSISEICADKNSTFYGDLARMLEAYVIYCPSVNYAQGMTYIAGLLLLHMEEFEAFVCMANVINNHLFSALFKSDIVELKKHLSVYDLLFAETIPAVYDHFKQMGILPDQYLTSWFSTMFAKEVLPLAIACRIWDDYLTHGEVFLYKAALGILKLLSPQLLQSSFEQTIYLLKHLPQDIEEKRLFEFIDSIATPAYIHNFIQRITAESV